MKRSVIAIMLVMMVTLSADSAIWPRREAGGGGGDSCATPTNFLSSPAAAHLYFWQDNSWAVAGDPDDEASGTDQALETSANLTDSGDLSNSNLPAGLATGGSYIALDMDGSTETAKTNANTIGFHVSGNDGPFTVCHWTRHASAFGGGDLWSLWDNDSGFEDDAFWYYDPDGSIHTNTSGGTGLNSTTGLTATATWQFGCFATSGGAGTATRAVYLDTTSVANDSSAFAYNRSGTTNQHGLNVSTALLIHAWGIWHSELSAADIKTMACCGINGEVTNKTARGTLLGIDCSAE